MASKQNKTIPPPFKSFFFFNNFGIMILDMLVIAFFELRLEGFFSMLNVYMKYHVIPCSAHKIQSVNSVHYCWMSE